MTATTTCLRLTRGGPLCGPRCLSPIHRTPNRSGHSTGCKPSFAGRYGRNMLPRGTGRPRLRRDTYTGDAARRKCLTSRQHLVGPSPQRVAHRLAARLMAFYSVTGNGLVTLTWSDHLQPQLAHLNLIT